MAAASASAANAWLPSAIAHVERELRTATQQRQQLQRYVDGVQATRRLLSGHVADGGGGGGGGGESGGGIAQSVYRDAMIPLFPLERQGVVDDEETPGESGDSFQDKARSGMMMRGGPQPIAFMQGRIVHTNEMLVCLGDGYYAEMSAAQASNHLGKRLGAEDASRAGATEPRVRPAAGVDAGPGTVMDALKRAGERCSVLEERLMLLKGAPALRKADDAGAGETDEEAVDGMNAAIFLDEGDDSDDEDDEVVDVAGASGRVPVCPVADDLRLSEDGLLRLSEEQFEAEEKVFRDVRVKAAERRRREETRETHFTGKTQSERDSMMAEFRAMELEEDRGLGEEAVRPGATGAGTSTIGVRGNPSARDEAVGERQQSTSAEWERSSPFVGNVVEKAWGPERGGPIQERSNADRTNRQSSARGGVEEEGNRRQGPMSKFKQQRMKDHE